MHHLQERLGNPTATEELVKPDFFQTSTILLFKSFLEPQMVTGKALFLGGMEKFIKLI